ncbi:hypothetical protein [Oenococcus oeni]|uniref:hypothetical protein n=1 Tax=Oenococcus oeni TaxID=1247 RepID=UPI00107BDEB7|nr:hypothetical protein [Oenococcus oeni]AVI94934.1 hypothetical protein AX764_09020 [Oenococcus oeni]SYW05202.1 hypothetical protein OENI_90050 [Oenococcus oeni]
MSGDKDDFTAQGVKAVHKSPAIFGRYFFFCNAYAASCRIGTSSLVGEPTNAFCTSENGSSSVVVFFDYVINVKRRTNMSGKNLFDSRTSFFISMIRFLIFKLILDDN